MKTGIAATGLIALLLLAACSAEQESAGPTPPAEPSGDNVTVDNNPPAIPDAPERMPVASVNTALPALPGLNLGGNFNTGHSVRTLMNAVIQPNADLIWKAVRYVVNESGVTEDVRPETEADWARLRTSAITLVEAGNALLLPGRVMDTETPGPDYPAYQFRPDEIQAMMESNAESWRNYIRQMQSSTNETLVAIENRDITGLIDTGASINNACQGCHAEFWYRPNN